MRVAVVGCGYVGIELGQRLAEEGHAVVGVRRSATGVEAIERAGLAAVRADATEPSTLERVPDADAVVFAASARGGDRREVFIEGLRTVIGTFSQRCDPPGRLFYTSSTGVYGDHGGAWVDEDTPARPRTERERVLAEAERVALERAGHLGMAPTVARLGGIYGPGRYGIDRYLDGPVVEGYRNAIHRDDAAGALCHLLLEGAAAGEVVNVVDDEPVSRSEFAAWLADALGREPPPTRPAGEIEGASRRVTANKRCSNAKLRRLGYELAYPTYREGYSEAIGANR